MNGAAGRLDRLELTAGGLSGLCLVHCVALPVASVMLPSLGFTARPAVHLVLLILAVPLAATALLAGWRRHGRGGPLVFGVGGLALLGATLLIREEGVERLVTLTGGLTLVGAHVANWRLRHAARTG